MKKKLNITILHNIISPYRLPIFEEMSKTYDLNVYFCKVNTSDRLWNTSLKEYTFSYEILSNFNIGPLIINLSLIKKLLNYKSDCFVIVENPENVTSILLIFIFAKLRNKKIILWNERIDDDLLTIINLKLSNNKILNIIYKILKSVYKYYRKYLYTNSDVLFPLSTASYNFLVNNKISKNKIFRSFQIVPESILNKQDTKLNFKNKKVILFLSYLTKRKGADDLIKAFLSLNRDDAVLLIAGSGDQESNLRSLADKNQNIMFLGYIDGIDKANYFKSADIFVFPTHYDVWGLVINEAMYYGLPIITTNKACASELIENEKTGFVINDNDIQELARKIDMLLSSEKILNKFKLNVRKMNKEKLVDVNIFIYSFKKAVNYSMRK